MDVHDHPEDPWGGGREVGVGPHPLPWPDDPRLDPELLALGDRRNVLDRYRYWSNEAIVADLDTRRHGFHIAIENWQHDRNIGTIVRTANAFNCAGVHIIGKRRWNRRGAMVTDRYLPIHHHDDVASFAARSSAEGLTIVAIDIVPGSVPIESVDLPRDAVLVFGQEGPGLSAESIDAASMVCSIVQFGSTRSINVGVAAGIAMHTWIRQHADPAGSVDPA
jgi:tRNA G18 (ribose-2'-O)-methylase SpoU